MHPKIDRRRFLRWSGAATVSAAARSHLNSATSVAEISPANLPRWRGFNLLEKFTAQRNAPFREWDFRTMAEWGFDFARLPLSYRCWAEGDPARWRRLDEWVLREVDQAVEFGRRHGVHININFHRAPGYCVNPPAEPLDLWSDEEALEAFAFHWTHFAERYKGISNREVSFDLLNEPARIDENTYVRVVRRLVEAIREVDSERLILADGLRWGRDPVHGLAGLNLGQSTRGYDPMRLSHHRASWIQGSDAWPEPTWPLDAPDEGRWDRERLRREHIEPWRELERKGVGVHVGEWGAFNRTPHPVALAWMEDWLTLWREVGWGWALWNFRGSFGLLDSGRADVAYESLGEHQLDRRMLELLRRY
jgi:endoglucanase